jgi:hypothetical protein
MEMSESFNMLQIKDQFKLATAHLQNIILRG